ncbi:MAG: PstS family phosphate ABC transporter substrate-binding protein [Actinobacteria bacterium]|nr:MAG: PstS family phosphate ABC transporter substrate-binding protein [Actinomycetota bacterium]
MKKVSLGLLAATLVVLLLTGCLGGSSSKLIQITGSDTMVNLARGWAQEFMSENPDIEISVDGGGSSVGIRAITNGTTDIASSSREISSEEIKAAEEKGVTPNKIIVGYDGIVVAVSPKNPLNKLTTDQIADIFSGKITNWKQVGGDDAKMVVFSRESSSGTYDFFKEHILNKGDNKGGVNFAPGVSLLNNSSQIVDQISSNPKAIGYFGMGYATKDIKEIKVAKDKNSPYLKPTIEKVKSKEYTISRSLQVYTKGEPKGEIKKFVDFMLGKKGQSVLEEAGFVSIK